MKKKILTLLIALAALTATFGLTACGAHEHCYNIKTVVAPTCTEKGYTLYECACGASYKDDVILAKGHSLTDYVCTVCGEPDPKQLDSSGLVFKLNADGESYTVASRGAVAGRIIKIPASYQGKPVTAIGEKAFEHNSFIEYVLIPTTVTKIGAGAFRDSESLKNITLPKGVTEVSDSAFLWCNSLANVNLPDGIKKIGDSAFYWDYNLKSIKIPNGVTEIGFRAFEGCESLADITMPENAVNIDRTAFLNCGYYDDESNWDGGVLYIGEHLIKVKETLAGVCNIKEDTLSVAAWAFYTCKNVMKITVPQSVKFIGKSAFRECENLRKAELACGLKSIENDTFRSCLNLKKIILPEGITSIGDYAFTECSELEEITIPKGVTKIGLNAFQYCASLKSLTVPEGITEINDYALSYCEALNALTLPKSLMRIGEGALSGCLALSEINYAGSASQWYDMEKGVFWNGNTGEYKVYCNDGTL